MPYQAQQFNDLGPCEVTYDGNVIGETVDNPDGGTHGGCNLQISQAFQETHRDQKGEDPHDEIITGQNVQVVCNFAGLSLEQLQALVLGSKLSAGVTDKEWSIENAVGTSLKDEAKVLILKPIIDGAATSDEDFWITANKAAPKPNFDIPFSLKDQKVYAVTFRCFYDANGKQVIIGKNTA